MNIPYSDVPYRGDDIRYERCRLDVHIPDDFDGGPTLVWFYGGGLISGERHLPEELRDQGIAVVTPDYRLHPEVRAPGYIRDAAAAVAWTFLNLQRFGGNSDSVFVGGASAGAYLASMVTLDRLWLHDFRIDARKIAGLVSLTGQAITHFTARAEMGIPGHQPMVNELAPLFHIRADAPPILLVTGDRELELYGRYEENAYFQRMLQVAGHEHNELHELPGIDHGGVESAGHQHTLEFIRRIGSRMYVPDPSFTA
jgi:acetyl esterase/lipase